MRFLPKQGRCIRKESTCFPSNSAFCLCSSILLFRLPDNLLTNLLSILDNNFLTLFVKCFIDGFGDVLQLAYLPFHVADESFVLLAAHAFWHCYYKYDSLSKKEGLIISSAILGFYDINCLCDLIVDCLPLKGLFSDALILPNCLFDPFPSLVKVSIRTLNFLHHVNHRVGNVFDLFVLVL